MLFPTETGANAWFALAVRPRYEAVTQSALHVRGLETFVPWHKVRRRWSDRVKLIEENLFPGYIFCRFGYAERLQVLNLPGVNAIVGPEIVPDTEIESVRAAIRSGLPAGPWPYLKVGHRVRIDEGVLAGLEGTLIREKDALRVIVNVELLQRSIALELDRDLLKPGDTRTIPQFPHSLNPTGYLRDPR